MNFLRQQSPPADVNEQTLCRELASRLNVSAPEVRRNSLLSSPCLTGITSPSILLPSEITEPVPLEKAFAHELAHVRRRDNVWNLVQRVSLSLFFFQPLMWRLVYRLEATAEEVCDDFVVSHCMDRTGYAEQLVALAESNLLAPNMAGLGMFKSSKSMLGHRVGRILDTTRKLTTHLSWPAIFSVIALTMAAATLGGFLGNDASPFAFISNGPNVEEERETGELTLKFRGRILDANGSPVAGANVRIVPQQFRTWDNQTAPTYASTISQVDGTFEIEGPQSELVASDGYFAAAKNYQLVASASGHGFNWIGFNRLQELGEDSEDGRKVFSNIDLKLTADSTKTNLRLVDTEGNAIAAATAKITHVTRWPNEDMSPFYDSIANGPAVKQGSVSSSWNRVHGLPEFKSDENGILQIDGIGNQRIVEMQITGPSIAVRSVRVATVAGAKTVSTTFGGMHQQTITTHAPDSVIAFEPTQPIVGRVIDRETKKPLANVLIMSSKFAGTSLAGMRILQTRTDEEGRFRLVGMPKGPGNAVVAVPDDDIPYFMLRSDVPAGSGLEPVRWRSHCNVASLFAAR